MTAYYWVASGPALWDTLNWSLTDGGAASASVPGVGDTAIFKASSSVQNCSANGAISITTFDIQSDYSGIFNALTYAVAVSGDCTLAGSEIQFGTGTWTIGGNFSVDYVNVIVGAASATLVMTGSGVTLGWRNGSSNKLGQLDISSDASATWTVSANGTVGYVDSVLDIEGTLLITNSDSLVSNGELSIGANGVLGDGGGTLWVRGASNSDGIVTFEGTLDVNTFVIHPSFIAANALLPVGGTYTATTDIIFYSTNASDATTILGSDDYVFDSPIVRVHSNGAGNMTVDNTADANITFNGSLEEQTDSTGVSVWLKGSGLVTLAGSGSHTIDWDIGELEDTEIDCTGTYTLAAHLEVTSLTLTSGSIDADAYDIAVAGDSVWDGSNVISMGSGTWTLSGNWDYSGFDGTLNEETSLVVMDGVSKTILGNDLPAQTLYAVNIDGTINSLGSGYIYQDGDLNINGTLTLNNQSWRLRDSSVAITTGGVSINGGSELAGTKELRFDRAGNGGGLVSVAGDLTIAKIAWVYPEPTGVFVASDYSTVNEIWLTHGAGATGSFAWQNGAYTFNHLKVQVLGAQDFSLDGRTNTPTTITVEGDLTLEVAGANDILIYNNHATDPIDFVILGDITRINTGAGEVLWYQGTGGIEISGAAATQNVNLDVNGTIEDVTVDKNSGKLTFTGNCVMASFLGTDGEIDFNGQTLETIGDFIINAANGTDVTIVSDVNAMNATDITVGNDFYISNLILNANDTWYLDVQGANASAFDVTVKYSDANAGIVIDATYPGNVDLDMTRNWNFGVSRGIQTMSQHCYPWVRLTNRDSRGFRNI